MGKEKVYLVVRWSDGTVERPVVVNQPVQLGDAMSFLRGVGAGRKMQVAIEPTGTYGDPLRYACYQEGVEVLRVSPVVSKHHAETYDGVPSQHDGKDAAVLAELGAMGKCRVWEWETDEQQDEASLRREVELMDCYQEEVNVWRNRLHGRLARGWPEAEALLELDSATLLGALLHYRSPRNLAADGQAAERLASWGGRFLTKEKIEAVIGSAKATRGVPMCEAECRYVAEVVARLLEAKRNLGAHKREVERLSGKLPEAALLGEGMGKATVAVLHVENGDPGDYEATRKYLRALGLNLKERSSGKYAGGLHTSKRGSARSRRWLYMLALRLVARSAGVRRWYEAKVLRDGGKKKGKALVAVMRKVAAGVMHCRRTGELFDAEKLFPGCPGRGGRGRSDGGEKGAKRESKGVADCGGRWAREG